MRIVYLVSMAMLPVKKRVIAKVRGLCILKIYLPIMICFRDFQFFKRSPIVLLFLEIISLNETFHCQKCWIHTLPLMYIVVHCQQQQQEKVKNNNKGEKLSVYYSSKLYVKESWQARRK